MPVVHHSGARGKTSVQSQAGLHRDTHLKTNETKSTQQATMVGVSFSFSCCCNQTPENPLKEQRTYLGSQSEDTPSWQEVSKVERKSAGLLSCRVRESDKC